MPPQRLIKWLLLLTCALLFALIGILILKRPQAVNQPFAQAEAANMVTVHVGTQTLTLSKEASGWMASAPGAGPYKADADRVKNLLSNMKQLEVEDRISEQGVHADDFQLNPGSATTIQLSGGSKPPSGGVFGKRADNGTHLYFQYADKPAIYLARGHVDAPVDITPWRNTTLLNLAEDQVASVLIVGPGYQTRLVRSSDTWSVNDRVVDPARVWNVIGTLTHLRVDGFATPADPLTYASITVTPKQGTAQVLRLGREDVKTKRYPASANADTSVGWLPENAVKAILPKPSEFLSSSSPAAVGGGPK